MKVAIERGSIEPPVLPVGQNLVEEPDLSGPGQPPRKIGIGGGLKDSGGDQTPPPPPTAEGDYPEDPYAQAERFSRLWRSAYPVCNEIPVRREILDLLRHSGLPSGGRDAIILAYLRAVGQEVSPGQVIPIDEFKIEIPVRTKASLGIFSPDKEVLYRVNLGLLDYYERILAGKMKTEESRLAERTILYTWRNQSDFS